jgi:phytoene synthase
MISNNFLSIHAKSFNWAGFFLPKKIYINCSNLYDFCRTIDDIADLNDDLHIKKQNLINFKNEFNNKNYNNLIIKNMWKLIDDVNISANVIDDLFDGIESDLKEKINISSKKEMLIYSYRVAGTVGLMMAKILKVKNKKALKSAIDLGIAMQLTNISRDVVEDAKKNRSYIKHNFESISETLKTADLFYKSSFASIKEIPFNCRFSILVARRVYKKIGSNILRKKNIENYNSSGKIYVSKMQKTIQTMLSVYDLIKLLFVSYEDNYRENEHNLINKEINLDERI